MVILLCLIIVLDRAGVGRLKQWIHVTALPFQSDSSSGKIWVSDKANSAENVISLFDLDRRRPLLSITFITGAKTKWGEIHPLIFWKDGTTKVEVGQALCGNITLIFHDKIKIIVGLKLQGLLMSCKGCFLSQRWFNRERSGASGEQGESDKARRWSQNIEKLQGGICLKAHFKCQASKPRPRKELFSVVFGQYSQAIGTIGKVKMKSTTQELLFRDAIQKGLHDMRKKNW